MDEHRKIALRVRGNDRDKSNSGKDNGLDLHFDESGVKGYRLQIH